ncbi:MAG: RNA polymerase sigma factor [Bryobacterales bacterium]|nr:RNA polymerase sigma factor [Bryobacterales bacterium]
MAELERSRYEDLLMRYAAPLRRLAWAYTRDGQHGDDLFQEIALALWTALPRFRGDSSERTWVYRVAHNTAISHMAGERRRRQREQTVNPPSEPSAVATQERDLLRTQQQQQLWRAVCGLPVADRQLVVLYLEGLAYSEIEGVTGVSQGNVATRLTRIRQRLASQLRGEEAR